MSLESDACNCCKTAYFVSGRVVGGENCHLCEPFWWREAKVLAAGRWSAFSPSAMPKRTSFALPAHGVMNSSTPSCSPFTSTSTGSTLASSTAVSSTSSEMFSSEAPASSSVSNGLGARTPSPLLDPKTTLPESVLAVAGKAAAAQPRSRSGKKASKQAEQNNKRMRIKAAVRLQSAMRRRLAKRTVAKLRLQAKQSAIHSQAEVLSDLRERWEANLHAASRPGYVAEIAAMARVAEVSQREAARCRAQLQERTEQEQACQRQQQQQLLLLHLQQQQRQRQQRQQLRQQLQRQRLQRQQRQQLQGQQQPQQQGQLSKRTSGDNEEQKALDVGSHSRHGTEQWRRVHASTHASTLSSTKPMRSGAGQPHPYSAEIEAVRAKHRTGNVLSASELFYLEEELNLEESQSESSIWRNLELAGSQGELNLEEALEATLEARHASTLLRHQPQASARSRTPRVTPRPRDSARIPRLTPRRRMPVIMPHQSSVALRVPHEASQPGSPQAASGEAAVNAAMIKLEARAKSRAAVTIVTSRRIQQARQRAQQVVAAWVESTLLQPLAAAGAAILPPPPLSTPAAVAAVARAPPSRPSATARAVATPAAPHSKPSVAQRM